MPTGIWRLFLLSILFSTLVSLRAQPLPNFQPGPYAPGADTQPQPGVPQGKVEKLVLGESRLFPGAHHDCWIYVPAQYDPATPACLMVFQDGGNSIKTDSGWRVPTVFDNLIAKKEMPVTIALFVNPGWTPPASGKGTGRANRSYEYDGLGDRYARFLIEEVIPEAAKQYNLTTDPNGRAIAGASSGAVCAFNAAWERPDYFHRVFSSIGTYTDMRGAWSLPTRVRVTEPKPLRVFLQDGYKTEMNIFAGNWWLANQAMLDALQFSGYEVEHIWGEGGHDGNQSTAILPDALRWLWKDYPTPVTVGTNSRQAAFKILLAGETWHPVGDGIAAASSLAADGKGTLFVAAPSENRIYRIGEDGKAAPFADKTEGADGLAFGADGKLRACQPAARRIVVYDASGVATPVAEGIDATSLAIAADGTIYAADPGHRQITVIAPGGAKQTVAGGGAESSIALWPEQTFLVAAGSEPSAFSFRVATGGSLDGGEPYYHLYMADGAATPGMGGVTTDNHGWTYFATDLGVQIGDGEGRIAATTLKPQEGAPGGVAFGGPRFDTLYAVYGGKVYGRKTQTTGTSTALPPVPQTVLKSW